MAIKHKWGGRGTLIVRGGVARGKSANSVTAGLKYNMCEEVRKKSLKTKFGLTFKTQFSDVKFNLHSTVDARVYDRLIAGLKPGEANVVEARNLLVWVSDIQLPTGYSMDVENYCSLMKTRIGPKVTYPLFSYGIKISVGPMVGKWTNYTKFLSWDIRGSGACKLK